MMGNIAERIVWWFKALTWFLVWVVIAGAIALGLKSMPGCTALHVSYDKHYVGEPPKEEAAADLIERIFDVETTEE